MDNCIFCKIISGEFGSVTIYEDAEFKVMLDKFPSNKGHVLILPKVHVENIFEIDPETAGRLFKLAVKIANALKKTLDFDGMNIMQNNGEVAGQTVNHFHLHLIPRYKNDSVSIKWTTSEPSDEELQSLKESISKNI